MPQPDIKILEENTRFWERRYLDNKIDWHINDVNPMLFKHLKTLIPSSVYGEVANSKGDANPKKVFIPLCGKTKDIPFLLSLGHEVFGVECVSGPIEELNEEHDLKLKFDEQRSLYESVDGKLKIFCGDFFKCPIETWGPFDVVWDRGSFIAIDYPLREAYVEMMKRAVAVGTGHKFRYLLQSVRYNKTKYGGPPRCVDLDDIATYLEPWASVQQLEMYAVSDDSPMRKVAGDIGDLFEIALFLTNKA